MQTTLKQRIKGCLLGVGAGDHNGGPVQMALMLSESLQQNNFLFLPLHVLQKYTAWFAANGDGADDTGPVAGGVFNRFIGLLPMWSKVTMQYVQESVSKVDAMLQGKTAGINGAHRGCVLAMNLSWDEQQLMDACKQETQLTHLHDIAYQATQMAALLCRQFVQHGAQLDWHVTYLNTLSKYTHWNETLQNAIWPALTEKQIKWETFKLDKGGFSPEVLRACFAFLRFFVSNDALQKSASASDVVDACLTRSFVFAGKANYCPVLIGAFLGSAFGDQAVEKHASHVVCLDRIELVTEKFAMQYCKI